jgi:hypothetical protein
MKTDKRSPITQQLVQRLRDLKEGEFITYEELVEVAACDIRGRQRYFLEAAIKIAEAEYSVSLVCEHNKGYRRLLNAEISKHANSIHSKRMRSDTASYRRKVECVNPKKLTHSQRVEYGLSMAYIDLRETVFSPESSLMLRQKVIKSPEQMLDKQKLLEDWKSFR